MIGVNAFGWPYLGQGYAGVLTAPVTVAVPAAASSASASPPALIVELISSASAAPASLPAPNFGEGIVPSAAASAASGSSPALSVTVSAVAASANASPVAPVLGPNIVAVAAEASASASSPDLSLEVDPAAADASADAQVPVVTGPVDTGPVGGLSGYAYPIQVIYDYNPVEVHVSAAHARAFMPTPNVTVDPTMEEIDAMFADLAELLALELV